MEIARVAAISLFTGLPESELAAIARVAFEHKVAAGDVLVAEGDFGHTLFAIESGSADILIGEKTVGHVSAGDVIGEIAVLSSGRRVASVRATTPMRLLCLFKRDAWQLERRAPTAAQRLRSAVEERRRASADMGADSGASGGVVAPG